MSLQPLKDMQVALMKSRYTAASAQREEVTKPKDLTQDRQSIHYKHHEDVSPASRPYRRQMPVQLHQSALWAAYIREHLDGLPSLFNTLCSAPDRGDSCIMQKENGYVNDYVVNILYNYIIV
ncbi:MAG: hypothetical protein BEH78_09310 [Pseudomonas sp. BDAL1]|nr:MAG: hypothetical protein BEH78_09310 [Pseudomonas sp. BDAL1]